MREPCAIYLRVSSDLQDYERQISDLKKFAKDNKLSYSQKYLYEDKLSGFKNEKEREGLNKLLNEVVPNKIRTVLVWEISRLGRKQGDLLDITSFFQKNGINVYFFIQRFWLLDETLQISPQAGLSIAFFGWHGEYEARLTKERFLSAKKLNESVGKYNGGKISFGYTIDKNNKYTINKKVIKGLNVCEADIVKEVFDLYEDGLTCSKICRICRSKNYPKKVCSTHTLARVLRDTSYIGFKEVKLGKRPTPRIISDSQFFTVSKLLDSNKTKADKGRRHVYLLRGIIKCSECSEFYVGKQTDDGYICPKNSGSNRTNKNTSCSGGNISISNIDGIIWERVKYWLMKWKVEGFDDEKLGFRAKFDDLNEQILRYENLLHKIDKQRNTFNIMIQNEGITVEEYQKKITNNKKEKEQCNKEIAVLQSEIKFYEKKREEYLSFSKRLESINSIVDRNQMKSIMKSLISEITFHKVGLFKTVVFIKYYRLSRMECIVYNSVAKKDNIFRLITPKYIRFDKTDNKFYAIKEPEKVHEYASTEILKENGIGNNLPDYIPLYDFVQLTKNHKRKNIKINKIIDYPTPIESNSVIFDFDKIMILPEIEGILTTHKYEKMQYFKDLNRARFNRKR
ncbi:MAG: recombinase family protein [Bacteroidales bacterium]|jgi:DNA invertase Pin-like site-specific DNA recombinase